MRCVAAFAAMLAVVGASAQELWMFGNPNLSYGVFRNVPQKDNPLNYDEVKIGNMDVKKISTTYQGEACFLYSSTGRWAPKPIAKNVIPPQIVRRYDVWVKLDGTVLRVYMQHSSLGKAIVTDAVFKGEEIHMSISENGSTRKTVLMASEGVEAFKNPFVEMMANADKDRPWVKFSCLEASTAGIIRYRAVVMGKFTTKIGQIKYEGRMIEVDGPGPEERYILYITNEGELLQVDMPDESKIHAQAFSALPPPAKSGGGGLGPK